MPRPFRPLTLAAALMLGALPSRAAPSGVTPPVPLRFYCSEHEVPMYYAKDASGQIDVVPPPPDALPPNVVFYKPLKGERVAVPFAPGNLSPLVNIPADALPDGMLALTTNLGKFRTLAAKDAKSGPTLELTETEAPLVRLRVAKDRPQLVILYQPKPTGKWFPPKSQVIDLSLAAFPKGACLVVNLAETELFAQFQSAQPLRLPSGASAVVAAVPRDPAGDTGVRLAVGTIRGLRPIASRTHRFAPDARTLLIVRSANPAMGSGTIATHKVIPLGD